MEARQNRIFDESSLFGFIEDPLKQTKGLINPPESARSLNLHLKTRASQMLSFSSKVVERVF